MLFKAVYFPLFYSASSSILLSGSDFAPVEFRRRKVSRALVVEDYGLSVELYRGQEGREAIFLEFIEVCMYMLRISKTVESYGRQVIVVCPEHEHKRRQWCRFCRGHQIQLLLWGIAFICLISQLKVEILGMPIIIPLVAVNERFCEDIKQPQR